MRLCAKVDFCRDPANFSKLTFSDPINAFLLRNPQQTMLLHMVSSSVDGIIGYLHSHDQSLNLWWCWDKAAAELDMTDLEPNPKEFSNSDIEAVASFCYNDPQMTADCF